MKPRMPSRSVQVSGNFLEVSFEELLTPNHPLVILAEQVDWAGL